MVLPGGAGEMPADARGPWITAAGLVATGTIAFWSASWIWTGLTGVPGGLPYQNAGPLREALVLGLLVLVGGSVLLRLRSDRAGREAAGRSALLMTAAGALGLLVAVWIGPARLGFEDVIQGNYGSFFSPETPGGTAWFWLIWGAPFIAWAGTFPGRPRWWVAASWWPALYYAGLALHGAYERMIVADVGFDALTGLLFATVLVTIGWLVAIRRDDAAEPLP